MADRNDYYFKQKLTEGELDAGFDGIEASVQALAADAGIVGIIDGATASETAPVKTMGITLTGPLKCYDRSGQRVHFTSEQAVDLSVDENGVSTAVVGGANDRWVGVYLSFDRLLSDPRTDGAGNVVYFVRDESFKTVVRSGAEAPAGTSVRPAIDAALILVCDVKLVFGQATVADANISISRREDFTIFDSSQIALAAGLAGATNISHPGNVTTALVDLDAKTVLIDAAHAQLITDLASVDPGTPGATLIGVAPIAAGAPDINDPPAVNLDEFMLEVIQKLYTISTKMPQLTMTLTAFAVADGTTHSFNVGTDKPVFVQVINESAVPVAGLDWMLIASPPTKVGSPPWNGEWEVNVRNESLVALDIRLNVFTIPGL